MPLYHAYAFPRTVSRADKSSSASTCCSRLNKLSKSCSKLISHAFRPSLDVGPPGVGFTLVDSALVLLTSRGGSKASLGDATPSSLPPQRPPLSPRLCEPPLAGALGRRQRRSSPGCQLLAHQLHDHVDSATSPRSAVWSSLARIFLHFLCVSLKYLSLSLSLALPRLIPFPGA